MPLSEKSELETILKIFLDAKLELKKKDDPFSIAILNNMVGMQNEALNSLEKACRDKEYDIPRVITVPELENFHSNPRFWALVDTMNLMPYFNKPSEY